MVRKKMGNKFALMQNICVEGVQVITCKREGSYKRAIISFLWTEKILAKYSLYPVMAIWVARLSNFGLVL